MTEPHHQNFDFNRLWQIAIVRCMSRSGRHYHRKEMTSHQVGLYTFIGNTTSIAKQNVTSKLGGILIRDLSRLNWAFLIIYSHFCQGIKVLRLDSVPESTIKTNLGINYVLNLTHLARMIYSLIGGKVCQKIQNGRLTVSQESSISNKLTSTN